MTKKLRISTSLSLPLDAVTETFGILAIKGVGKTYLEMKMAEEMVANRLPIIPIDSMGIFWGLRAHADGKGKGLPITIMGGEHADVPLVPSAGRVVAELLAKENFSCILDVSDFRKHEQRKFVMEFSEEFYHWKKKYRDPVHLFLDEADLWAPQKVDKGYERLLGAIDDIVRRGRQRGIGCTMATQRAAVINKSVLGQISVLIAMQMSGAQDIDAVDYWISKAATREGRTKFIETIPSLDKGEAFVWSPAWLKIFRKVRIGTRWTFDSSRTPKVGERLREPKQMAEVDIKKISKAIAETVEKVKHENPKLLREENVKLRLQIRDLETRAKFSEEKLQEERKKPAPKPAPAPEPRTEVKIVKVPVMSRYQEKRITTALRGAKKAADKILTAVEEVTASEGKGFQGIFERVENVLERCRKTRAELEKPIPIRGIPPNEQELQELKKPMPNFRVTKRNPHLSLLSKIPADLHEKVEKLRLGERKILQVFIQHYPERVTHARVGALAGYAYTGETYRTYFGVLKRHQLVDEESKGAEEGWATELGAKSMPSIEVLPQTTESMLKMWNKQLRAGERKILADWVEAYPKTRTEFDTMTATGIANEQTFRTYTGVLKRLQLGVEAGHGKWKAADSLFPEGR